MELKSQIPAGPDFVHVCDHFDQGTYDDIWIPSLEGGGWIVISSDSGKGSRVGGKLPRLCVEHKITHIIISPKLHMRPAREKIGALLLVWDQVEKLDKEPPGTRFKLRWVESKGSASRRVALMKSAPQS